MYGANNPVDGAVLEVILRKAEKIREELGVPVPVPDEGHTLTQALLKAVLWRDRSGAADTFDFMATEPGANSISDGKTRPTRPRRTARVCSAPPEARRRVARVEQDPRGRRRRPKTCVASPIARWQAGFRPRTDASRLQGVAIGPARGRA